MLLALLVQWGIMAGKPSVAYVCSSNITLCLNTNTDIATLTFDYKINGFPGFIMEHLFGDPSSIDF